MTTEELKSVLAGFFTDCDELPIGYSNNITAAIFAIAGAIKRHAEAVERVAIAIEGLVEPLDDAIRSRK